MGNITERAEGLVEKVRTALSPRKSIVNINVCYISVKLLRATIKIVLPPGISISMFDGKSFKTYACPYSVQK